MAHYFEGSASAFSIHSLRAHPEMVSSLLNRLFSFLAKGQSVLLYLMLQDPECEWLRVFLNRRIFRSICFEFPHQQIKLFFQKCIVCFRTASHRLGSLQSSQHLALPGRKHPLTSVELDLLVLNWCSLLFGSLLLKQQYQLFFNSIFTKSSFSFKAECTSVLLKLMTLKSSKINLIQKLVASIHNFFIDLIIFEGSLGSSTTHSLFSMLTDSLHSVFNNQPVNTRLFLYLYDIIVSILRNDKSQLNVEPLVSLQFKVLKKLIQIKDQAVQKLLAKELVVLKALLQNKPNASFTEPLCTSIPQLRSQFKILLSTLLPLAETSLSTVQNILSLSEFKQFIEEKVMLKIKAGKEPSQLQEKAILLCFKGQSPLRPSISTEVLSHFLKQTHELDLEFNAVQILKSNKTGQLLKQLIQQSKQFAKDILAELVNNLEEKRPDIALFKILGLIQFVTQKYPELLSLAGLQQKLEDTVQSLPPYGSELKEILAQIMKK